MSESRGPDVHVDASHLEAAVGFFPHQPLYYAWEPRTRSVVVGTLLAAVVRAVGGRPLNLGRLVDDIAQHETLDPRSTPFEGIHRLLPGERIEVSDAGFASRRQMPSAGTAYLEGSVAEMAEGLREAAAAATVRAMGGARKVAVFVGGGLDSSGVLALAVQAARRGGGPEIEAIALDYEGPGDDRPHLHELAEWLDVAPTRLDPRDAAPWFLSSLCLDAHPGAFSSDCFGLQMGKTAMEHGAARVLEGTWGDAVLGPLHGFGAVARRGKWLQSLVAAARLDAPWESTPASRIRDLVVVPAVRRHVPPALLRLRARRRNVAPWLTPTAQALLAPPAARSYLERDADTPDAQIAWLCASEDARAWADNCGRESSGAGCDRRDVFYDGEFLKFMARIDPARCNADDTYRGLFKRAMKGLLPEGVRTRRDKAAFEPAVVQALRAGDGFDVIADLASVTALSSLGLVDAARMRPVAEGAIAAARRGSDLGPRWEACWRTLAAERFARLWGGSRLPPEDGPC